MANMDVEGLKYSNPMNDSEDVGAETRYNNPMEVEGNASDEGDFDGSKYNVVLAEEDTQSASVEEMEKVVEEEDADRRLVSALLMLLHKPSRFYAAITPASVLNMATRPMFLHFFGARIARMW